MGKAVWAGGSKLDVKVAKENRLGRVLKTPGLGCAGKLGTLETWLDRVSQVVIQKK
jgi:hypothetical protein